MLASKIWAEASGSIFVNTFGMTAEPLQRSPSLRRGLIPGGGKVIEVPGIRLALKERSIAISGRVQNRINSRFSSSVPVAKGTSMSYVDIRVPREYARDRERFLQLVMHLYLNDRPEYLAIKAKQLGEALVNADPATMHRIALTWEGIGGQCLQVVREYYANPNPAVAFHAVRTGARLEDNLAVRTLGKIANMDDHPYQEEAIQELGYASWSRHAPLVLLPLLNSPNARVRRRTYEALLLHNSPLIDTKNYSDDFKLDLVDSKASPLIYVTRFGQSRIALFGNSLRVLPPVFYRSHDGTLTISGDAGSDKLLVVRQMPITGRISKPFHPGTNLMELIDVLGEGKPKKAHDEPKGVGMTFSQICSILNDFCEMGIIPAKFLLQPPSAADTLLESVRQERTERLGEKESQ
jgi:hypothetical protein